MKEAQLMTELAAVWRERERLTTANNMMVNAYSELVVRFRAYENLINRSFFLRLFLRLPRIEREIERINIEEVSLKGMADAQWKERVNQIMADAKLKNRQKELDRILKKSGNQRPTEKVTENV